MPNLGKYDIHGVSGLKNNSNYPICKNVTVGPPKRDNLSQVLLPGLPGVRLRKRVSTWGFSRPIGGAIY